MNGDKALIETISASINSAEVGHTQIVVAPPAPLLALAREKFKASIGISAQNCSQGTNLA